MAKSEASVEELVTAIERGDIRLPEMQRRYVWKSTRVRDLLDSLYRGYPSGAILLWETDEDVPVQDFAIETGASAYTSSRLLLDGQQRLTSLAAIIRGKPVTVRGRKRPIDLLFNLEHPDGLPIITEVDEESDDDLADDEVDASEDELQRRFSQMTFIVATNRLAALPQWVKVTDVFGDSSDVEFLRRAGVESFDDPRFQKYSARLAQLRGIRSYSYRMDVLERSMSYDEVTEIFVRVNSLGAKLRSSDLALAQITARWRNSLGIFQAFQRQCAEAGFDLELAIHLKSLVAFATDQSRFRLVSGLNLEQLQASWAEATRGMEFALNFLRSNCGVESPEVLSSPFITVTLAYFGHKRGYRLDPEESTALRQWVLIANAKGRYSRGSTETYLDQDLATLRNGGSVAGLMERLRAQAGRLDITPGELEGRNQRSAIFKTMFLAFRSHGARDWSSDLAIDLNRAGTRHRLQFHHIFPKAYLRGAYPLQQVNDIANLAFIDGSTNRRIRDTAPEVYLANHLNDRGPEQLEAQAMPTDPALFAKDRYPEFLIARRRLIADALNEFLGV